MAYAAPNEMSQNLDDFVKLISKNDTTIKLQVGQDLLSFLEDPSNSIECEDISRLIDGLVIWIQGSNFKVSSNGIEIMTCIIERIGISFKRYVPTVLPHVIDRLGDSKDSVREKSQLLLMKLLERNVLTPQVLLDKLFPAVTNKNAKVREEVLRCLMNIVNEYGTQSLSLSKFISNITSLLSDPAPPVRDAAVQTLVDLYKHIGEKLRIDLKRKNLIPQSKWATLNAQFDQIERNCEMSSLAFSRSASSDEVDRVPLHTPSFKSQTVKLLQSAPKSRLNTPSGSAGALDEGTFVNSFEDVPSVQIFSSKEVTETMKNIQDTISDSNKDWTMRQTALKKIRSLVIAGALDYEEFYVALKKLEIPLQGTIKDLRSQVVREACISLAFLAKNLGTKFDKMSELLLPSLINLIQNSAKIMATAGIVTIHFIIQSSSNQRLIPIITSHSTTSKSKDIRRNCCEFLAYVLNEWPVHSLERHVGILQGALKKGIADADPEARVFSRKAFMGFRNKFPEQAEVLLQSLDPTYRRALQSETTFSRTYTSGASSARGPMANRNRRSNSAIDLNAAKKSGEKFQYVTVRRPKMTTSTASLPRPRKSIDVTPSPERAGRTKNRSSQSQPTSRSTSPSSRLAYLYRSGGGGSGDHDGTPRPRRLASAIPRSTSASRDTSREPSPNRSLNRFRTRKDRPPLSPASRPPVLAQKILQQSREAENALADVFKDSHECYRMPRKVSVHSDESETSSICSERSFDSSKRQFMYSWSDFDSSNISHDINEIISCCASSVWQERKDGLISLQNYMNSENLIESNELSVLTELFTKMFMDSHTKDLGLFLDTLQKFIRNYGNDVHNWIYVLLQRVFLKIGTETLNSTKSRLMSLLEVIRGHLPAPLLISNVHRFLNDSTQTPNTQVKIVVLKFLTALCNSIESTDFVFQSTVALNALQKIINFTQDIKSSELRNSARNCIVAMWNCNTPQVTMMFSELPKELQDIASNIVQSHLRRSTNNSETNSPNKLPPTSPGVGTCNGIYDHDEIYKSLKKTTTEIQNYNYENLSHLDRNRDTTSQDSGISQMSTGNDLVGHPTLEEKFEDLTLKAGPSSMPYSSNNGAKNESNGFQSLGVLPMEGDIVKNIIDVLAVGNTTPRRVKVALCKKLVETINEGNIDNVKQNFRTLLRIFIEILSGNDPAVQFSVLEVFAAIFRCDELKESWIAFVELLTLRLVLMHHHEAREVAKQAEATTSSMKLEAFEPASKALGLIILTQTDMTVEGAIKMLTTLIEAHPNALKDEHLEQIMPGLIKAADHAESSVRKSAIFCMVAIHRAVGENRLKPYLDRLNVCKKKLVRLYIER